MEATDRHELFLRLWSRHERDVRRYVWSLVASDADADDLVQETAVALWKKFEEYDPQRPFVGWACRFARLEVLKHRERKARKKRQFCDAVLRILEVEREEHESLLDGQQKALRECVERLSDKDRQLLQIRYQEQGGIARHADETGLPVKKMYTALERIRRELIKCVSRKLALEGWS